MFILNQNGPVQVLIDGQLFNKQMQSDDKIIWKCTKLDQHGCKAFVVTSCTRERKLLNSNMTHNHKTATIVPTQHESKDVLDRMKQFRENLRLKWQTKRKAKDNKL